MANIARRVVGRRGWLGIPADEAVLAASRVHPVVGLAFKARPAEEGDLGPLRRRLADRSSPEPGIIVLTRQQVIMMRRTAFGRPTEPICSWLHAEVAGINVKPRGSNFLLSVVFADRSVLQFEATRSDQPMRIDHGWRALEGQPDDTS